MRDNPFLFQQVKERVDIVEAAERYGLAPDRRGWCSCPFHGEKTPSFHLYNQHGKCFGCGWSGDIIDLVAGVLNISSIEAVKAINKDFALGIDLGGPVDELAVLEAARVRREKERFKAWREGAVRVLSDRFRELHQAKLFGAGYAAPDGFSDAYTAALKEIDGVEYYLDLVAFGEKEDLILNAAAIDGMVARCREEGKLERGA